MKTDIEIANSIEIKPIYEIADKLGIDRDLLEPYGKYKAKLPLSLIDKSKIDGKKLVLVSAISPTPAGIRNQRWCYRWGLFASRSNGRY